MCEKSSSLVFVLLTG